MWSAASVLACALSVFGRSEASMPPIKLIDLAPPGVSAGAEAFVRSGTIYLITSSSVFQEALRSRIAKRGVSMRGGPMRSSRPPMKCSAGNIMTSSSWTRTRPVLARRIT